MEKNTKYRIVVIFTFFVMVLVGLYIGFKTGVNNNDENDITSSVINKEDNNENVEIYNTVFAKTYDIELIYEDYYSLCGETITNKVVIYDTTLDEVKKSEIAKKENKDYIIVEESNEKIVFRKIINENCPNHFNVKLEDGVIVIYNIITDSKNQVYKKIEIQEESIRSELTQQLKNGIKINSQEELNLLIEDLES